MADRRRGDAAGPTDAAALPDPGWERSTSGLLTPALAEPEPDRPTLSASRRRTPDWLRPGTLAVIGVLIAGLVVCLAAADTNTLVPQSVRPITALPLAGPFASLSFRLSAGPLIAVMTLMFVCYGIVVWRTRELSPRVVIGAVVAINVVALIAPPLFSTDVFSYQAYARMFAIYHINPYVNGPTTISLDPYYYYIGAKWISTPSVYGPLFTLLSAAFAHATADAFELIFKVIATLSSLGTSLLIWRSAKLRGVDPVAGIALFGLNPLVVLYGVGGGHNDLLMLLLSTGGVYVMLQRRHAAGGALIAAGAAIKLTGALVAPFAFAALAPPRPRRERNRFTIGFIATAAVLAAAGFVWFGKGLLHMPSTLESVQNQNPWGSIPGVISSVTGGTTAHYVGVAGGLFCAGLCVWLLRRVWLGRTDWIEAAAWTTVAMVATASAVLPWYAAWMLPLIALCQDRRLWWAALTVTSSMGFLTVAGYVPGGAFFGI